MKNMVKYDLFEVSNYVIIFNNKLEILMVKSSLSNVKISGKWGFPGGHVKYGESMEEAINREVEEEVNISIKEIIPVASKVIDRTLTFIFCAKYFSGEIKLSDEHSDFKWVKISEMDNLDLISEELINYAIRAKSLVKN
jgi:8-oxo-dGTP diphosphatase